MNTDFHNMTKIDKRYIKGYPLIKYKKPVFINQYYDIFYYHYNRLSSSPT